jgi:3-dehydrosphinganine reductase
MKIKAKLEPGKVAVVTGGSSGIGKAIACELAERGMHVWLLAQRKDLLISAQKEVESHRKYQNQVIGIVSMDVSDLDQVHKAISFIYEKCSLIDLLVNSAGVTHPGYVEKQDINIFHWMMEVNYFGTVYMTKEVIPAMLSRGSGYILNVCSFSGIISSFGYTAYGASKYAVHGFTEALRMELNRRGIGVSILFPTDTDTPQLKYENQFKPLETKALNSAGGLHTPEEVAKSALNAITRGRYFILPNFDTKWLYWLNRLSPSIKYFIADIIIANALKKENSSGVKIKE